MHQISYKKVLAQCVTAKDELEVLINKTYRYTNKTKLVKVYMTKFFPCQPVNLQTGSLQGRKEGKGKVLPFLLSFLAKSLLAG